MMLYRFFDWEGLKLTLLNNTLRIGRFENLDDPFELLPAFPENFKNLSNWIEHYDIVKGYLHDRYGILCFAEEEKIYSSVMWSGYADKHKGGALGFEIVTEGKNQYLEHSEHFRRGEGLRPVHKVNYCQSRVKATEFDRMAEINVKSGEYASLVERFVARNGIEELLQTKGPEWEYQSEWRSIFLLSDDFIISDEKEKYYPLQNLKVAEVILGWKSSAAKDEIKNINPELGPKIRKMKPSIDRYSLAFDEEF